MAYKTKRSKEIDTLVNCAKVYSLDEAIATLQKLPKLKFDESVEAHFTLGIDPKQTNQAVNAKVTFPHGTGKEVVVAVLTTEDKVADAKKAGATFAGEAEVLPMIESGKLEFDVLIASPDQMKSLGKHAKMLGPRGLMPTPKGGTLTPNIAQAVSKKVKGEVVVKANTRIKVPKGKKFDSAPLSACIGKLSFSSESLSDNLSELVSALLSAKPATSKGQYLQKLVLSSSMGSGLKVDLSNFQSAK